VAQERELKLDILLDEPAEAMERLFGRPVQVLEQLNRYYVPASPAGVVLRLREEGGGLILTVKGGGQATPEGVFVRQEHEQVIPSEWLPWIAEDQGRKLIAAAGLGGILSAPLAYAGQNRNTRRVFRFRQWEVLLDTTDYPDGRRFHEIEVEHDRPEDARADLTAALDGAGIPWRPAHHGKFARLR
jgi:inorganic triphosphatase YgiF